MYPCLSETKESKEMYQQCTCEQVSGSSRSLRNLWGPVKHTVVGKLVSIEEDDGSWSSPWKVIAVYGKPTPEKYVRARSRDHIKQRKASDI